MGLARKRRRRASGRKQQIARFLSEDSNRCLMFTGQYYGWKLKNIPAGYLQEILNNVDAVALRDVAQIELIRRANGGKVKP